MAEEESIERFVYAANNLIESKYILIDRNISVLLHSAVDSEIIYNLIASSMINFDFVEEWKNATQGNQIQFPEEDTTRLAFIFCMLNNIDDRKLDITKVLEHYFSYDANVQPYELFCKTVIVDFKNLVLKGLNLISDEAKDKAKEEEQKQAKEKEAKLQESKNKMLSLVYKLKDEVRSYRKIRRCEISKNDVIAVISTLEFAIKSDDLEYFYALVLALKALLCHVRNLNLIVLKIEEISNTLIRS